MLIWFLFVADQRHAPDSALTLDESLSYGVDVHNVHAAAALHLSAYLLLPPRLAVQFFPLLHQGSLHS